MIASESLVECYGRRIARRFRTDSAKTLFAKTVSKDPIVISNVVITAPTGRWTERPAPEDAFSVHVVMTPLPRLRTRASGRHINVGPLQPGDICLVDLGTSPISLIQDPLESVRIQINQRTLDDLAYDHGRRPIQGLRPTFGVRDPILHGLSAAILGQSDIYGSGDQLFLGHVALALFTHLAQAYGVALEAEPVRGGLTPSQFRRARELMTSRLAEGVSVPELAETCGLSASYFSRAFRQSAGVPAHRWLMNERVERAKGLLEDRTLSLPEIALACGFSDQSHLTRVFSLCEGQTPGRWRRIRAD